MAIPRWAAVHHRIHVTPIHVDLTHSVNWTMAIRFASAPRDSPETPSRIAVSRRVTWFVLSRFYKLLSLQFLKVMNAHQILVDLTQAVVVWTALQFASVFPNTRDNRH